MRILLKLIEVFNKIHGVKPVYFDGEWYKNGNINVQLGISWPLKEGFITPANLDNNRIVLSEVQKRSDSIDTIVNITPGPRKWIFRVIKSGKLVYKDHIFFTDTDFITTWAVKKIRKIK